MTTNSDSELRGNDERSRSDPDEQLRSRTEDVHPDHQMSDEHRPAPDSDATTWTTGKKFGVGTAYDQDLSTTSSVWFTLTAGALTELRFPRVDLLNVRLVDFLIVDTTSDYTARTHDDDRSATDTLERTARICESDALVYRHEITETGSQRSWRLTAEYCTDPAADTVLLDVEFETTDGNSYDVYAVTETAPSGYMAGTAGRCLPDGDGFALAAWEAGTEETAIRDEDGSSYEVATAVAAETTFEWATVGSLDSDHVAALFADGSRVESDDSGSAGNRILVGQLGSETAAVSATLGIGFAEESESGTAHKRARASLDRGYEQVREEYVAGWESYLEDRSVPDSVADDPALRAQYKTAALVLKAVESKQFPGASVASPSVPWGENVDATEPRDYGYNFTWSRDLYQVVTALLALDDPDSVADSIEYLYEYQQREDGFLPQNTHLDGRTRWGGEQLDNIAYPAVIAYQYDQYDGHSLAETAVEYEDVRRSSEYLLRSGPRTEQERWEEEEGYSPSTIAAEVAGLGCASVLAAEAGERADALAYLAHADRWREAVDEWCVTDTGTERHDETPYYVRISDDGEPDEPTDRTLANNGPTLDERDIVDAGFLELVRLGLRDPNEDVIENSVAVVDERIRVETPQGPGWYRYNGDGYGELGAAEPDEGGPWDMARNGKGRLWPIFTGERGEYELCREEPDLAPEQLLETMANFANSGRMIPEQIWDRKRETEFGWEFGTGTGAATPLAWSMAQYIRLAHSIDAGEPVERPQFLAERYDDEPPTPRLEIEDVSENGESIEISGRTDGDEVVLWTPDGARLITDGGEEFECSTDHDECAVIAATGGDDLTTVGTAIEQIN